MTMVARRPVGQELEELIARAIEAAVGSSGLARDRNLFEQGAASLHLVSAAEQLEKELGCAVPVVDMFRYPTIESFSAQLQASWSSQRRETENLAQRRGRGEARRALARARSDVHER